MSHLLKRFEQAFILQDNETLNYFNFLSHSKWKDILLLNDLKSSLKIESELSYRNAKIVH